MDSPRFSRRRFLTVGGAALMAPGLCPAAQADGVLGQGDFRYRIVPGWGGLGAGTPEKNCHGIVCDSEGNLILLTDEVRNNFIAYDPSGKRLHKWSRNTPGRMAFPSSPRAGRGRPALPSNR